jgi:hypothetical protein
LVIGHTEVPVTVRTCKATSEPDEIPRVVRVTSLRPFLLGSVPEARDELDPDLSRGITTDPKVTGLESGNVMTYPNPVLLQQFTSIAGLAIGPKP